MEEIELTDIKFEIKETIGVPSKSPSLFRSGRRGQGPGMSAT